MSWTGLGTVTVATPGTKVPLSATDIKCNGIIISALSNAGHTNTGRVYLYDRTGKRLATLGVPTTGVIPMVSVSIDVAPGGMNVRDFTVDADTATDGVDASYIKP